MKHGLLLSLAASAVAWPSLASAQTCPPTGWDRPRLEALKSANFEIADAAERERFARALVACVASPDPVLRDGVAFDGLTHMLRGNQLTDPAKIAIAEDLLRRLGSRDPEGFEAPFAALVLSEIVRADRIQRYLPDALRDTIVDRAIDYVVGIRDYRGFDAREGWRHGVAHGADLLMQIAYNPHVADPTRLAHLRDAVGAQVGPTSHAYVYGEPERLLRPIVALAQRNAFTQDEWTQWFATLMSPAPFASWRDAVRSQEGLARRHNLQAFVYAAWLNARLSQSPADDVLLPGAEAAVRALP